MACTAGALGAWDAFTRTIPHLKREGKYDFIQADDGLADVLTAPFDLSFLGRWTTWLELGFTAAVAGLVLGQRQDGVRYEP